MLNSISAKCCLPVRCLILLRMHLSHGLWHVRVTCRVPRTGVFLCLARTMKPCPVYLGSSVCCDKKGRDKYTRCYPNAKHTLLALAPEEFPFCPGTVPAAWDRRLEMTK